MFDFEKPKIEIAEISEDKRYGKFVVEPLERGYGTTLGNSLRRIMLSSLPGAAVSQVKIDGVLHEFSSIPGVKEDVTEIIMNIKSLAIKNSSETNEPKTAYIEFEGEGVITAADIHADSDIEILNPDQVIATLSVGALPPFGIAQRTVPQRLRLRPGHYVAAETLQFFEISAVEQLVIVPAGRSQQIGFQHNFRIIRFGCSRQRSSRNACSQTSVHNGYARFR